MRYKSVIQLDRCYCQPSVEIALSGFSCQELKPLQSEQSLPKQHTRSEARTVYSQAF